MAVPWLQRAIAAACALAVLAPRLGEARPFSVEDLLRTETLLGVEETPDGRWLVLQVYRGEGSAGRFGDDAWPQPETSELLRVDLRRPGPATPFFPRQAGTGYLPGPISPRGDRMVVYRLQARTWRAGIYDFAKGSALWLPAAPEIANYGRFVQWVDDRRLLMVVTASGAAPERVGFSWQVRDRRMAAWAATAKGDAPADRLMGSGRFLQMGRPAPAHRLELWTLGAAAPRALGTGDFLDLQVSPDGRYAALLEEEEAIQAPPSATLTVATPARRRDLRLVDLTRATSAHPCPACDLTTHLLSWSAGSGDLLVYATAAPGGPGLLRVHAQDGGVSRVSAPNLVPRRFASPENIPFVHAGWLHNDPLIFAEHADAPGDRADWYRLTPDGPKNLTADLDAAPTTLSVAGRDDALIEGAGGVWRLGLEGAAVSIAKAAHLVPVRALGDGIRFAQNPDRRETAVVLQSAAGIRRLDQGAWRPLPAGDLLWTDGTLAVARSRDDHGVGTVTLSGPDRPPTPLLTLNGFLAEVRPAVPQAVPYALAGRKLTGWLYLPQGAPGARPPLVVIPYPGSVYDKPRRILAPDGADFATGVPILVGAGFAVLVPSVPQEKTASNWSEGITPAILAATDAAVATGLVDPERLALLGHSGGGYAVLVAAAQTHRFKAVVAENATSNLLADWGALNPLFPDAPTFSGVINLQPGWSYGGQAHLWADPWTAPARYEANSPFFAADRIDAAVLLISADHDFVQLSQSESLFSALYRQNRDAALLSFWGEGHVLSSPANLRVAYATILQWLRANLEVPAATQAAKGSAENASTKPTSASSPEKGSAPGASAYPTR